MFTLVALCLVVPAAASPRHVPPCKPPSCADKFACVELVQAQKNVFAGHDGHVGLPAPQDWVRYQPAEVNMSIHRNQARGRRKQASP